MTSLLGVKDYIDPIPEIEVVNISANPLTYLHKLNLRDQ